MWPKLRFDASAARSPFASFAAAAYVAARACVYGSTPTLIRRTPIVWSSARVAASWGLTRTLTGLGATALITALMEAMSGRFGA
jgi:hypothetical protein